MNQEQLRVRHFDPEFPSPFDAAYAFFVIEREQTVAGLPPYIDLGEELNRELADLDREETPRRSVAA